MTDGHKHREVRINPNTHVGGAVRAFLCKPRYHTTDVPKVDASPYPYGMCRDHWSDNGVITCYYLSILSVLHRWTGLTLLMKDKPRFPNSKESL